MRNRRCCRPSGVHNGDSVELSAHEREPAAIGRPVGTAAVGEPEAVGPVGLHDMNRRQTVVVAYEGDPPAVGRPVGTAIEDEPGAGQPTAIGDRADRIVKIADVSPAPGPKRDARAVG